MATLIAAYNSEGCTGRCDARCYEATGPVCDCICGGMNHGAGRERAEANTSEMAEVWVAEWKKQHSDTTRFDVPAAQLALPIL